MIRLTSTVGGIFVDVDGYETLHKMRGDQMLDLAERLIAAARRTLAAEHAARLRLIDLETGRGMSDAEAVHALR